MGETETFRNVYISAKDGLKLHVREYGPRVCERPTVVCLPGMARNAADFHALAEMLANDPDQPHRVICIDYRGRGLSEWDPDWTHYNPFTELDDLQQVLIALAVDKATFVGTSRGGLIVLGMAATTPELINAVVFNDIGPVIEPQGLARIRGYLGNLATPANYQEAVGIVKDYLESQFTALEDHDWEAFAQGTWLEKDGALKLAYDPALKKTLEGLDLTKASPPMWPMFDALHDVPMMAVRGENSDILRPETLTEMQARRTQLETLFVPNQGHAPVMTHPDVCAPIARFINSVSQPPAE